MQAEEAAECGCELPPAAGRLGGETKDEAAAERAW